MQPCLKCRDYIEELKEEIRQLKDLSNGRNLMLHPAWKLSSTEAIIFKLLIARSIVTKEMCINAIGRNTWDEDRNPKILDIFICRLRKKVGPFGISITNCYGQGRSISPEQQKLIKRACEGRSPVIGPPVVSSNRREAKNESPQRQCD